MQEDQGREGEVMAGESAKHPGGRPTEYKDEFVEQGQKLCNLGATDAEIADFFGVDVRTIYRWKLSHPEFCQSLTVGKERADERVTRSLYQKATGFKYTEEQAIKIKVGQYEEEVEVVTVEREALPDTPAAIFWLKNRCGWKDKAEVEHSGNIGMAPDLSKLTDEELKRLAELTTKAAPDALPDA